MSTAEAEGPEAVPEPLATPGLSHHRLLAWLDRTGLPSWLIGLGCFLVLTLLALALLILVRVPDPAYYRNSVAFTAITSFLVIQYFAMGRGWYRDLLVVLAFDPTLDRHTPMLEPSRRIVAFEFIVALVSGWVNLMLTTGRFEGTVLFKSALLLFYFLQYAIIIFCMDVLLRQTICLWHIAKHIRIDLWETDFYSTLANPMQRFFGLYVFGLCVITMSFLVFTEGNYGAGEMMVIMMPWYLPGLLFMSVYLIPYDAFRRRVAVLKRLELNKIGEALKGNRALLRSSLLAEDAETLRLVDLLGYQDRINRVREWPFTDRIRALVLFGVLPPLTWVLAALIEIMIESSL